MSFESSSITLLWRCREIDDCTRITCGRIGGRTIPPDKGNFYPNRFHLIRFPLNRATSQGLPPCPYWPNRRGFLCRLAYGRRRRRRCRRRGLFFSAYPLPPFNQKPIFLQTTLKILLCRQRQPCTSDSQVKWNTPRNVTCNPYVRWCARLSVAATLTDL